MTDVSEDDDGPESDPYCAHWRSIFDEGHAPSYFEGAKRGVPCDACGHPCGDHPVLWGLWCEVCRAAGKSCQYVSAAWPAEQSSTPLGWPND